MNTPTPKITVLIVDDEQLIRWSLGEALRDWGYETLAAENAATAWRLFAAHQPAIVLLDINLPDGSGLDLLREIKTARPTTGVIMITAEVIVPHTISALRGGADDFIGKPINLEELRYAIEQILKHQHSPVAPSDLPRPRVLLLSDQADKVTHLSNLLAGLDVDFTGVSSSAGLVKALDQPHDLVLIELAEPELKFALSVLRADAKHTEIPILVDIRQIAQHPHCSSLLAQYRAMPCTPSELAALARRRVARILEQRFAVREPLASSSHIL